MNRYQEAKRYCVGCARDVSATPDDYLANVDHLRIEMGRWVAHDAALRLVIGEKFVECTLTDPRAPGQPEAPPAAILQSYC